MSSSAKPTGSATATGALLPPPLRHDLSVGEHRALQHGLLAAQAELLRTMEEAQLLELKLQDDLARAKALQAAEQQRGKR